MFAPETRPRNCSYLSVIMHPSFRRVLRCKVQTHAAQCLIGVLVFPYQLEFTYGNQIGVWPDFHEKEFTEGKDLRLAVLEVLYGFVEGVGGMMTARRAHKLEKRNRKLKYFIIYFNFTRKLKEIFIF